MHYVYKVKQNLFTTGEIQKYFSTFTVEETNETLYAINYLLPPDSEIVRALVKLCNDPKFQKSIHVDRRRDRKNLSGMGFEYEKVYDDTIGKTVYKLIETEELLHSLGEIQIVVEPTDRLLYINCDGNLCYYSAKVLENNIPDIIEILLKENVIYKTKAPEEI